MITGDWNGDGKTDIAVRGATGFAIYLSTGSGFISAGSITAGTGDIPWGVVADWNNDGATDIWIQQVSGDKQYLFNYVPELMTTVSNGIDGTTQVTYDRLNKNGSFYTKGTGATYPTQDMDGAQYVVSRIDNSNGLGVCTPPNPANCYTSTYTYAGAKTDLWGRGFLGFTQITITDQQTHVVQTTNYDTAFPLTGFVASEMKVAPNPVLGGTVTITSATNTPDQISLGTGTDGVSRYFVALKKSLVLSNDENFATGTVYALPNTAITTTYDCDSGICAGGTPTGFGNAVTVNATIQGGTSRLTTNTWLNDSTHWLLGRLTYSTVLSTVPGTAPLTRTSSATYDMGGASPSGLVTSQTVEPTDTSRLFQNTAYTYDAFGNKTSVTVSSYHDLYGAPRTTGMVYDSNGQFVVTLTNALGQSETWGTVSIPAYDARFGVPTNHTDLNNLTTSWTYDNFGRVTQETRPDGNLIAFTYTLWTNSLFPTIEFFSDAKPLDSDGVTQNGPIVRGYYDGLSRKVIAATQGYNNGWIYSYTQFDANARVGATSRPYFHINGQSQPESTAKFTNYLYDPLGRVTLSTFPDASTTIDTYCGLTTSVTNGLNQVKTTVKNPQGLVASVVEAVANGACGLSGHATAYLYDAFGDLTTVTDPYGDATANTFDIRGRKTLSSDPDMGAWSYVYDAFSELTSQTDANLHATTLTYDLLGRVTQRVEVGQTSNWVYGDATTYTPTNRNIGQLISACNGTGCTSPTSSAYFRAYAYDSLGRPSAVTLTIAHTDYTYSATYSSNDRLQTLTYPSGFVAKYIYTGFGYLAQIQDHGAIVWIANSRDAELHLTQSTTLNGVITSQSFDPNTGLLQQVQAGPSGSPASLGNWSYDFDVIGNLTSRTDTIEAYTENFCYDTLNRLTGDYMVAGSNSCTTGTRKNVVYNSIGNIASKSDVGTYTYPTLGAGSVHPHAVSSVATCTGCTVNGIANPTYTYDANGNMTSGAGRAITLKSFNMAAQIVQGSTTVSFAYDSEHARTIQTITGSPSAGTTTYLNAFGGMSEKFVSGSSTTWHDYIQADGDIVAERFNTGGTVTTSYFVLDHLGSVQLITDDTGAVTERDSYDAWGLRAIRMAQTPQAATLSPPPARAASPIRR